MKSFRILVVEDNRDLLGLVLKYLELCGWRAAAADSETEFFYRIENETPNLVLLNMGLAGTDSSTLVSALKSDPRYGHIPVVAMAGPATTADRHRCIIAGCDRVIAKPFHLDELRRQVQCFAGKTSNKVRDRTFERKSRKHLAAVVLLAAVLGGCAAVTGQPAGTLADDARISTAVQATLTGDKASNFTRIDVDTTNGVVYLNGVVANPEQRARAEQLATRVDGVRKVVNNLQVGS